MVLRVESGQFEAKPAQRPAHHFLSPLAWEVDGGICTIPPLFAWGATLTGMTPRMLRSTPQEILSFESSLISLSGRSI